MVVLIAVAVALEPGSDAARAAVVVGLALSLVGDVLLMLPRDRFVPGLGAFLAAHLAYLAAFVALGVGLLGFLAGLVLVGLAVALVGTRILVGARASSPALVAPVAAYLVVISLMVAFAYGTGRWLAIAGASLFYASDAVIGWTRFVGDFRRSRVLVMVTYHLGQLGLVLALL